MHQKMGMFLSVWLSLLVTVCTMLSVTNKMHTFWYQNNYQCEQFLFQAFGIGSFKNI